VRRGSKPAKTKVEAKQAITRKSLKNNASRVRDLEKRLAEVLEQQTATAEILNVISRSPTDLQPMLEAVAQNASRLCGSANVSLYRVEGDLMRKVAEQGPPLTALRVGETRPITRASVSGRAIVDRTTIHLPNQQSAEAVSRVPGRAARHRHPDDDRHSSPPRRGRHRRLHRVSHRIAAVLRARDRATPDLRRPGGHRHRERAAV
jgi:hypothetical protein